MTKLPVVKTIAEAYAFALGELGTVIGLIWLPLVLAAVLNFLPVVGGEGDNPAAAGMGAIENVAILMLTQLLYAMIYVAVTRQALGLRQGPAMIHFALGPQEFRVFMACLLLLLMSFAGLLTYAAVLVGFATIASAQGSAAAVLLDGLAGLGGGLALLYVLLRAAFLLVPVAVVENRVDLLRGWALTAGNFWRILAVLAAVALPILLIETGILGGLMGREVWAALPPENASDAVLQQHMLEIENIVRRHMPALLLTSLILAPFNLGLSLSASAFGYRALAQGGREGAG